MIIEERIAVTWLSSLPKNPINPKLIITAEVNGTIANTPQSTLLKNKDASIPITRRDAKMLMNDDQTSGIVMIGEIGGQLEADAARWIKKNSTKPVVGFIAGQTAPKGRTMGHAGAIVGGKDDTAKAKMKIMSDCGIHVVKSPAMIGKKIAEIINLNS